MEAHLIIKFSFSFRWDVDGGGDLVDNFHPRNKEERLAPRGQQIHVVLVALVSQAGRATLQTWHCDSPLHPYIYKLPIGSRVILRNDVTLPPSDWPGYLLISSHWLKLLLISVTSERNLPELHYGQSRFHAIWWPGFGEDDQPQT